MQRHNVYRNNLRTFKRQMKFRLTIILYLLFGLMQPASALEQVKGFFQIRNGEDLVAFARLVNSGKTNIKAVLVSDISYCEYDEMIGSQSEFPFCGVFEGACHKITFDMESDSIGVSLFRFISHSGVVRNLYVKGNIRSHNKVAGGLVAFLRGGTISNCLCKVNISSDYTGTCSYGGIVGTSSGNSSIVKSVFDGRISAPYGDGIGGLVGWADSSGTTIRDCHVSCDFELRTLNNSNSVARALLPNDVTTWGVYYLNELGAASDGTIRITQEQWQFDDILYNFYRYFFNHEEQEHEIDSEYYQNLLAYLGLLFVFTAMTAAVLIMTLLYYKERQRTYKSLYEKASLTHEAWKSEQKRILSEETPFAVDNKTETKQDETLSAEPEITTEIAESTLTDQREETKSQEEPDDEKAQNNLKLLYAHMLMKMEQEHLYRNPNLDEPTMAQAVCSNKSYISECINRFSDQSNFSSWLAFYRINHAIQVIEENPYIDIKTLYVESGFNNHTSFTRHFKSIVGMTASQYIKIRKEKKQAGNL